MKKYYAFFLIVFILAGACKQKDKSGTVVNDQPDRFINPPIKGVDVPYKEYNVDATAGDTLTYSTGSVLVFPPSSFVDGAGNVITGNVQVKYREFADPIDFFLAGIPMQYDSAGKAYQFISSGMMEILAYKDGKPVFVNQKNKPEVFLNSSNEDTGYSVYLLDTIQKNWINKGGMTIIEPGRNPQSGSDSVNTDNTAINAPVKPMKADNKSPVMEIVIEPGSFTEFSVYKGLKFQVDESKTPFNAKDSSEEWNKLELVRARAKGNYMAKFSNTNRTATYAVKPVFEGEDYNKALKTFEKERTAYDRTIAKRDRITKANRALYIKDSTQNRRIEIENEKIERSNKIIKKRNQEIEMQNEIIRKENKRILEVNKLNTALRGFSLDGFGYWNSDMAKNFNYDFIKATFKDENGSELNFTYLAVIVRGFNAIISTNAERLDVILNYDNMILGVCNGKFAYVSFSAFKKLNITADTKAQTFIMKVVSEKDNNYEYIKSLMKQ